MVAPERVVIFTKYKQGNLYYKLTCGFEFPVPIEDAGEATFLHQDKAMLFMRWIRKQLEEEIKNKKVEEV